MSRLVITIPLQLRVKERETGKIVLQSTHSTKTKMIAAYSRTKKAYDESQYKFECAIFYSKMNDCWNCFEILNAHQLDANLKVDLEIGLIESLLSVKMLEKKYVRRT